MTTDIKELLPCPFCNSDMSSVVRSAEGFSHSGSTLYVPCDCGAMGPEGKTIDEAIAAWNRRTPVQLSAQTAVKTEQPSLSDAEIVEAVNAAHARGRIALTFFSLEGVEKPTDVARSFARELLAQRQDSDKDAERFRWIEENCHTEGGGKGFTIFVPVDHEDIGCGIDVAIANGAPK